jgi:hypothetical protein
VSNPLVLQNYPYKGKFSPEQVREALDRKDRLVELMMDPVGPDGTLINIPVDMLHILAFHVAYAGGDAHTDERQLIESRLVRDENAMFELYEWRPRGEFGDQTDPPSTDDQAAKIAEDLRTKLTPEVRDAVAAILLDQYNAAGQPVTKRETAEAVLLEQRELGDQRKDTE